MTYKGKSLFQVLELKKKDYPGCNFGKDCVELVQSRIECGVNYITFTGEPNLQGRMFFVEEDVIRQYPKPYGNVTRLSGRECKMYAVPFTELTEIPYEKIEAREIQKDDYDTKRLKSEKKLPKDRRIYTTTYNTMCQIVKPMMEDDVQNIFNLPLNANLKEMWENERQLNQEREIEAEAEMDV